MLARGCWSLGRHFSAFRLIGGQGPTGCAGGVVFTPVRAPKGRNLAEHTGFFGSKRQRSKSGAFSEDLSVECLFGSLRVFQFLEDVRLRIAPFWWIEIIAGRSYLEQLWNTKHGAIGGWMI